MAAIFRAASRRRPSGDVLGLGEVVADRSRACRAGRRAQANAAAALRGEQDRRQREARGARGCRSRGRRRRPGRRGTACRPPEAGPGADEGQRLGDVGGERAAAAQEEVGERLRLLGVGEARRARDSSRADEGVVLEVLADARGAQPWLDPRPRAGGRRAPIPESMRSHGEPIAPAERITSRPARAIASRPRGRGSGPRARARLRARARAPGALVWRSGCAAASPGAGRRRRAPAAPVRCCVTWVEADAVLLRRVEVGVARDPDRLRGVDDPRGQRIRAAPGR